jgi:hypothetical protein
VFLCVARGFKACPSFMFVGCCWWRSSAIDGGSGTSRGHGNRMIDPLLRRSVCAAGQPALPQVSRGIGLPPGDHEYPLLTGRSGTQRARGGRAHGSGGGRSRLLNLCPLPARDRSPMSTAAKTIPCILRTWHFRRDYPHLAGDGPRPVRAGFCLALGF